MAPTSRSNERFLNEETIAASSVSPRWSEINFLATIGVPEERFHVIPNGIDPKRFNLAVRDKWREETRAGLGLGSEERMVLFAGTDGVRKGLSELLQALADTRNNFEGLLLIAGNDPPSRWRLLARELGIADKVRFHGHEPQVEKVVRALRICSPCPRCSRDMGTLFPKQWRAAARRSPLEMSAPPILSTTGKTAGPSKLAETERLLPTHFSRLSTMLT